MWGLGSSEWHLFSANGHIAQLLTDFEGRNRYINAIRVSVRVFGEVREHSVYLYLKSGVQESIVIYRYPMAIRGNDGRFLETGYGLPS